MTTIRFPTEIQIEKDPTSLQGFIGKICEGGGRFLVVTGGERTQANPLYKLTLQAFDATQADYEVLSGISSNPDATPLEAAAQRVRSGGFRGVVTVGGGSVHDAGKLLAVLARQEFAIRDLTVEAAGYSKISADTLPVHTVPLLAGTGAEISPASLVKIDREKKIVFSPHMYPASAHYNLGLMFTDDARMNLLTGFDAYVQSLEAYLSREASPWSDMFACSGMQSAIDGLLAMAASPADLAGRERLVYAAIQGLMAVSNSSVGAVHALSDPLSGLFDVHHGTALALVAAPVLKINLGARRERFAVAASMFNKAFGGLFGPDELPALVNRLLDNIYPGWREFGRSIALSDDDLRRMVADTRNPDMAGNPAELSDRQIFDVFSELKSAGFAS